MILLLKRTTDSSKIEMRNYGKRFKEILLDIKWWVVMDNSIASMGLDIIFQVLGQGSNKYNFIDFFEFQFYLMSPKNQIYTQVVM